MGGHGVGVAPSRYMVEGIACVIDEETAAFEVGCSSCAFDRQSFSLVQVHLAEKEMVSPAQGLKIPQTSVRV